ncbi:hypothetical protein ACFC1B_06850 [Streptomyces xiamenensis]|uniref:hypothetical protein n=1 Tax=Streptomyces xiamenensis TaxID=408015 RepID=UPI0035DD98F8
MIKASQLAWYPTRVKNMDLDGHSALDLSAYDAQVTGERNDSGFLLPRFRKEAVELMATRSTRTANRMSVKLNRSSVEVWSRTTGRMICRADPVEGWYHIPSGWQETRTLWVGPFDRWYGDLAPDYPRADTWTVVFEDRTTWMSVLATFRTPSRKSDEQALCGALFTTGLTSYVVPVPDAHTAELAARAHLHAEREGVDPRATAVDVPFPNTVIPGL